jgi:BMFP domain-containing protein YqiC
MEGVFTRLNLVTREEFDVQAELLARTREKLTELEAKLDKMAQPPATEAAQEFVAAKKEEAGM